MNASAVPHSNAQAPPAPAPNNTRYVALVGNPNCGKTTVFNALTGLRAKVGNYPGVTVERKEGRLSGQTDGGPMITILDLPGAYSLSPQSMDEQITRDVLFHRLPGEAAPDLVVAVIDASNLQRNLYFTTQVLELGYPTVVALNMVDVALENGHQIDAARLEKLLGAPVLPIVASRNEGLAALRQSIASSLQAGQRREEIRTFCTLPQLLEKEVDVLVHALRQTFPESQFHARAEALLILSDARFPASSEGHYPESIRGAVAQARGRLESQAIDWRSIAIEARYAQVASIQTSVTTESDRIQETASDKLDRIFTHRVWGLLIFVGLMTLMFQSIFSFAELPMTLLEEGVGWVGGSVGRFLPQGPLHQLIVDGIIAGVGAVVVFLPQICLLFFFIGLMEDTGYMARAAFLMDRLMSRVGLHGKSFIPMLSSFACAIPGIMATRTIENPKDRLVTILVAPLMSCSARLPVYAVLIAACIPPRRLFGIVGWQGLTMLAMYLLGIVVALFMAWLFKKTLLKGPSPMLIMELPPYKRPLVRIVLRHMWDRSKLFLRRAGTVILGITILLWFLMAYPKNAAMEEQYQGQRAEIEAAQKSSPAPNRAQALEERLAQIEREEAGARLRHSFAGRMGHGMEPILAPLGFDWKIGIGIVASFAAREVFVSTMSQVYNVGALDDSQEGTRRLAQTLQQQVREDGRTVYTPLVGVTLMVFYVFALQCVSTVAVVRRETNGWKWPVFQWIYMGVLAWVLAFVTYQGGRWLGLG